MILFYAYESMNAIHGVWDPHVSHSPSGSVPLWTLPDKGHTPANARALKIRKTQKRRRAKTKNCLAPAARKNALRRGAPSAMPGFGARPPKTGSLARSPISRNLTLPSATRPLARHVALGPTRKIGPWPDSAVPAPHTPPRFVPQGTSRKGQGTVGQVQKLRN
jgi:hypothetical protein